MRRILEVTAICLLTAPALGAQLVPCTGGSAGIFPCAGIDLLALVPLASMGGGNGNDLWGWTDPQTGREYALMGRTNGTAFVDVSDPENPVVLGNLPTQTVSSSWRDIKTFANHAFIVADNAGSHGMQVFDLTRLRNVANPPVTFSADTVYTGFGSSHNVAINEDTGFAYAVDSGTCSGGLHMIDISIPTSPVFAGCHSADGTIHDAQCITYDGPDTAHRGREICFTATLSGGDTMDVIDVTDKGATVTLSTNGYPGSSVSHQGWISEDHRFFFHGDEGDESSFGHNTRTYVFDVTDLDDPVLVGSRTGPVGSIDHNLYVSGGLLYEANYTSGLRILDIADAANANLPEIAFFDTRPENNATVFQGAWSVYPFFDSCTITVSDIQRGLFVLRHEDCGCGNGVIDPGEECDGPDLGGASCSDAGCMGGTLRCTASCTFDVSACTGCPTCSFDVDFDDGSPAGWTNLPASTCSTGSFVVANPTQQANGGVTTQVGGDHTSGTGNAFFSAVNTAAGTDDVDGGTCVVESPVYAVGEASDVSIWYFHGQRDAGGDTGDFFELAVSTDGGANYAPLVSIGDVTSNAAWTEAVTSVPAGSDVRFRVQVADGTASGDLVEAGVDDLLICATSGTCSVDADCDDGLFCNGAEICSGGACLAGTPPCTASETCDEANDVCVGGGDCLHEATFETGAGGWSQGASTCTTGSFVVGTPDGTDWQVAGGNPGQAFFTQPNPGGVGTDDVDGGTCEALSPVVDADGEAAVSVSLDYFHGQRDAGDDAADGFTIELLNDGVVVDTLVSIGDVTHEAQWTAASTTVSDPGFLQLRVRASDAPAGGDIVEGGVDNVRICRTAGPACTVDEDFESGAAGWSNDPASTCTTGAYVLGDPTNPGGGQQIVGSHSGTGSLFTGVNTSAGVDDVDGGNCVLGSPTWPVAGASTLSVWYWHGQRDAGDDAAGDFFLLEYSIDGGASWNTLASNGDSASSAAWTNATASIPPGSNVAVRVQCSDGAAAGDLVECGIDDVTICAP